MMGIPRPQSESLKSRKLESSFFKQKFLYILLECQEPELVPRKRKLSSLSRIQPFVPPFPSWELFTPSHFQGLFLHLMWSYFPTGVLIFHHFNRWYAHRHHEFFALWVNQLDPCFSGCTVGVGHPTRPRHLVQRHGTMEWPCCGAKSLLGHYFLLGRVLVGRDEQKTTIHGFLRVRKSTMSRGEGKEMKQTGLECQSDLPTHVAAIAVCRGLCKGYMLAMSALTNFAESLGLLDWIHSTSVMIFPHLVGKKQIVPKRAGF